MWALTPWGGHVPPGKARGDLSVISGFDIPTVWQDGVGAPGQTRGARFVLQAIRGKSVHPQIKCILFS